MNNKQILEKAIKKAVDNGWNYHFLIDYIWKNKSCYNIIFSHDFAKAFWGDKTVQETQGFLEDCFDREDLQYRVLALEYTPWLPVFKFHLQQAVIKEEPLKYIERFI